MTGTATRGTRDDFLERTKTGLANRVGWRCSNPGCRALTIGPSTEPERHINLGVAAHITAASPGGTPVQSSTDARAAPVHRKRYLALSRLRQIDR